MPKKKSKWIEIVNEVIKERKAAGLPAGVRDALDEAKKRYAPFKKAKAEGKKAPEEGKPAPEKGHKGAPSKTRPGHLDYKTHKGSEHYNRDDHWQDDNQEGVVGKPYGKRKTSKRKTGKRKARKGKGRGTRKRSTKQAKSAARLVIKNCKLCGECKRQVRAMG